MDAVTHHKDADCTEPGGGIPGAGSVSWKRSAKCMTTLLTIVTMLVNGRLSAEVFTGENRNDRFTIHGRLSCYNGGSSLRIWIIGSKRMLYVAGDPTPALDRINKVLGEDGGWFTRDIFADFTVEPLEPDKKGHMRPVRILDVTRVVITKDDKVTAKRDRL